MISPLWVESPWWMERLFRLSPSGIQGTGLFYCLQVLSSKPCLSLSWTTSFLPGKYPFHCKRPWAVEEGLSHRGCWNPDVLGWEWWALSRYIWVPLSPWLWMWVSQCGCLCLPVWSSHSRSTGPWTQRLEDPLYISVYLDGSLPTVSCHASW